MHGTVAFFLENTVHGTLVTIAIGSHSDDCEKTKFTVL
jgi:hypothetical protein